MSFRATPSSFIFFCEEKFSVKKNYALLLLLLFSFCFSSSRGLVLLFSLPKPRRSRTNGHLVSSHWRLHTLTPHVDKRQYEWAGDRPAPGTAKPRVIHCTKPSCRGDASFQGPNLGSPSRRGDKTTFNSTQYGNYLHRSGGRSVRPRTDSTTRRPRPNTWFISRSPDLTRPDPTRADPREFEQPSVSFSTVSESTLPDS